ADAALASARQFARDGKIVVVALTPGAGAQSVARLLEAPTLAATEAPMKDYALLAQIDFQHPLFAPFADPRFSDFTKVHFWKHRRLQVAALPGGARVLARFDGPEADPAIIEIPIGKGNLFVLAFGWFPSDSQLALSSKFVPLLYSVLEQSGAIKAQTSQYTIGDSVDFSSLRPAEPLTIRKPDGTGVKVPVGERFTQTDL